MEKNNLLYYIRGGACILVILIHCELSGVIGQYITGISRIAVPIFFLTSGYYANRKNINTTQSALTKQLLRISKMTIYTAVFYCMVNIVCGWIEGDPIGWLNSFFNWKDLTRLLFFNRAVFLSAIMWYFFAMIYICIIVKILIATYGIDKCVYVIPILFVLNIIIGEIGRKPWYYTGNFLFTGIPFYLTGYYMKERSMVKSSKILVWTLSIIGFLLTIIEIRYIGNSYVYIGTIITSIAIFRLSFMYDIEEGNNFYYKLGRNYSTMIFIVHCAVIKILNQINFTNE